MPLFAFLQEQREQLSYSLTLLSLFCLLLFIAVQLSHYGLEPTGTLSWDGQQVVISGPIACPLEQHFELQVTLTQGDVEGAGAMVGSCLGGTQLWVITAAALASARFAPGTVQVCTIKSRYQAESVIDVKRWCRGITLLGSETYE